MATSATTTKRRWTRTKHNESNLKVVQDSIFSNEHTETFTQLDFNEFSFHFVAGVVWAVFEN